MTESSSSVRPRPRSFRSQKNWLSFRPLVFSWLVPLRSCCAKRFWRYAPRVGGAASGTSEAFFFFRKKTIDWCFLVVPPPPPPPPSLRLSLVFSFAGSCGCSAVRGGGGDEATVRWLSQSERFCFGGLAARWKKECLSIKAGVVDRSKSPGVCGRRAVIHPDETLRICSFNATAAIQALALNFPLKT